MDIPHRETGICTRSQTTASAATGTNDGVAAQMATQLPPFVTPLTEAHDGTNQMGGVADTSLSAFTGDAASQLQATHVAFSNNAGIDLSTIGAFVVMPTVKLLFRPNFELATHSGMNLAQ